VGTAHGRFSSLKSTAAPLPTYEHGLWENLMAFLIDKNTRVICQGFTGKNGTSISRQAIAYGTKMVAAPRRQRRLDHLGLRVRHRRGGEGQRRIAMRALIYVPPPGAADPSRRRSSEIALIICITEGIPVADM